jgi:hypothetical protein
MTERRRHGRVTFERPVNICTDTRKDRAGMARDLSPTGILFYSRSAFAVGERVELLFRTERELKTTTGRVVRASHIVNPNLVFPNATAVEFDVANDDIVA